MGGGPAGLAAAAELLRFGQDVTLFECSAQLGGMLNQALPDFRLPREVVEQDLKYILDLGLKTRLNRTWGRDFSVDDLFKEGFQAVIIAVGLPEAVDLDVPGRDLEGAYLGLDFLRQAKSGKINQLSGPVVVIGGGSVAVDAAMTALRKGGSPVTMVCLEAPEEIPAHPAELKAAREEGVNVHHRWGALRIEGRRRGGHVVEITLQRCLRVFDEQRRFAPILDPTITITLPARQVILAIGQRLPAEMKSILTTRPGVFLAGDALTGSSSIVSAMASGKLAAEQVQAFWGMETVNIPSPTLGFPSDRGFIGPDEHFHSRLRAVPEILSPTERALTFEPYEQTLTPDQAREEAARCLRCHLRAMLIKAPLPPDLWRPFQESLRMEIPSKEGVLILADQAKKTIQISGSANLNMTFRDLLTNLPNAVFCRWELDPMFTKRESELIGAHLAAHGEMPGGGELDDLF
ncbi:MAG: FAD-dependent oxidoreductase [Calditrichota bacterium]